LDKYSQVLSDAVRPRDGTQSTIALCSEVGDKCNQQSAVGRRLWTALATSCRPGCRCCQQQTDRCGCLYRIRRPSACSGQFLKSRVWDKVPEGSTYPNFIKLAAQVEGTTQKKPARYL